MHRRRPLTMAFGLVLGLSLGAGPVGAEADAPPELVSEARAVAVPDGAGGTWSVRLEAPAPGSPDLRLTADHVDARGAHAQHATSLPGAAVWWPTIAPLEHHAYAEGAHLAIDVTRIGFREYPVARVVF